jgi:hypothetical protein
VPLGLMDTEVDNAYSIHLNAQWLDNGYEVFLEDQLEGVFHDLRSGPYTYNATSNQDFRFRLRLGNGTVAGSTQAIDGWIFDRNLLIRSNGYAGPVEWRLYDIAGKVVARSAEGVAIGSQEVLTVPVDNLAPGMYMLVIEGSNTAAALKVRKM